MPYFLLLIGFALLVKGADNFVDGASNIAGALRVSPLLIGLTIVAFGTSAPEASVSFIAAHPSGFRSSGRKQQCSDRQCSGQQHF